VHEVRCVGPKIAALLARPEAADARAELALCEDLGVSPSQLRGRPTVTSYVYDDAGRVVEMIAASPWTDEDRKLLLAHRAYLATLCPGGCGQPREKAHHPDNDGWYEAEPTTCYACTAREQAEREGSREPVKPFTLIGIHDVRDYDQKPLPPLKPRKTGGRR
jgi:hypothetical protein